MEPNIEPNIWLAAQHGDVATVQLLLETVNVDARDAGNASALHWAAVGNHQEVAKLLLARGADANGLGGDLQATPLHWAARNGLVSMVDLLIKHGGKVDLQDSQGYNALILASHGGHTMLMLYLIVTQGMDVDTEDTFGRTALMWSTFMGLSFESVDCLIELKADVNKQDKQGLTALHWACITHHYDYCRPLLIAGANADIRDMHGKTAEDIAKDDNIEAYRLAGKNVGANQDDPALYDWTVTNRILGVLPFVAMPLIAWTFGFFPWFLSIPLMMLEFYGMFYALIQLLGPKAPSLMIKTVFPTAFFQASCYWVFVTYWIILAQHVSHLTLLSIFFNVTWVACMYNLYATMYQDPGYLAKQGAWKETLLELAKDNELQESHYCSACRIKRMPRSKHCKICKRCVARFDHHCPYTHCCVGATNHRRFLVFTSFFTVSAASFVILVYNYYKTMKFSAQKPLPTTFPCKSYSEEWCALFTHDSWCFFWAAWSCIHIAWVGTLTLQHLWYAAHAKTTYEWMRSGAWTSIASWDRGSLRDNLVDFVAHSGREWVSKDENRLLTV
jgi:ankyrin repeat protein